LLKLANTPLSPSCSCKFTTDEADNHLIESVITGNSSNIVTHNTQDFKQTELSFPELSILKPEEMIRLPDEKHERLKELAKRRNISVNKLVEELSTFELW